MSVHLFIYLFIYIKTSLRLNKLLKILNQASLSTFFILEIYFFKIISNKFGDFSQKQPENKNISDISPILYVFIAELKCIFKYLKNSISQNFI